MLINWNSPLHSGNFTYMQIASIMPGQIFYIHISQKKGNPSVGIFLHRSSQSRNSKFDENVYFSYCFIISCYWLDFGFLQCSTWEMIIVGLSICETRGWSIFITLWMGVSTFELIPLVCLFIFQVMSTVCFWSFLKICMMIYLDTLTYLLQIHKDLRIRTRNKNVKGVYGLYNKQPLFRRIRIISRDKQQQQI